MSPYGPTKDDVLLKPFSPVCRDNEPHVRNLRRKSARYRPGDMISLSALERDILCAGLDLVMLQLEKEKTCAKS